MNVELTEKEAAHAIAAAAEARAEAAAEANKAPEAISDADRVAILEAARAVKAWNAERRAQIDPPDGDGMIVVRLIEAVTLADGKSKRKTLTIRPITLGDVRAVASLELPKAAQTAAFADRTTQPEGAFNRLLTQADASAVTMAVDDALGKYLGNGRS